MGRIGLRLEGSSYRYRRMIRERDREIVVLACGECVIVIIVFGFGPSHRLHTKCSGCATLTLLYIF